MLPSAAFLVVGLVMLVDSMMFNRNAERLTATVVSVAHASAPSGPDRDAADSYLPTLDFTDRQGIEHQLQSHISSDDYDFAPGAQVEVLYNPAVPGTVRIAGFFSEWGLPLILMALGWGSLMVVRVARRKLSPAPAGAVRRR